MASDGAVLDEILAAHIGLIDRIIGTFEHDPENRADLRQEVVIALWRATSSWRRDCSLRTFVARVTHNIAVSHVRKATRRPAGQPIDAEMVATGEGLVAEAERIDLQRRLQHAVSRLPEGLRVVATLHLEGFSAAEIAATVGTSEGAVFTRITRAKAALKTQLGLS